MPEEGTAPAVENNATESVTTPTNTNEQTQPAPSATPYMDKMSEADRVSIDKFLANNGGMEAFNKWKQSVSNPTPKEEVKEPAQPEQQIQKADAPVDNTPARQEGFISPNEIAALQYNNMLVNNEKYSALSDYIEKGEYLDEMRAFGIQVMDQYGNLNDGAIRRFLDLKAQTVAATAPTTPAATTTPTVDYSNVGETITSNEDAMKVLSEVGHPMHDAAIEYMSKQIFGSK